MTLADASQTLAQGGAQAILSVVVLALVAAMSLLVRHHLGTQETCRAEKAALLAKIDELQEKRLALAERVLAAVDAMNDEERKA